MKVLRKNELEDVQGGFNKSFWNGFCDGAAIVGLGLGFVPIGGKVWGELAIGGLAVVGCFNGPA
ncbi:SLC19 family protein [Belliella sp. DSM 111904]|uniref:SLC19 family protein n=1 Tax=Belliella filtrata TaxID=2923435 RepID=A0ABS9V203_9BACT|nr:SLC19 family protein [Belliella filtrata]MCH7410456.1 SLC19 family protein [Belliella filtrata]